MRRAGTLEHSDLAPMAYLRIALDGVRPRAAVKHLLVDEMQDYTPIQYRVIGRLFPCRKTLLGDAGQSLRLVDCRHDSAGLHRRQGDEALQKLSLDLRDYRLRPAHPPQRRSGTRRPTRRGAAEFGIRERRRGGFRDCSPHCRLPSLQLHVPGHHLQNRSAGRRASRATSRAILRWRNRQRRHLPSHRPQPHFCARGGDHLGPHGQGLGIRRSDRPRFRQR